MKKRLLGLALALVMIISLLPLTAIAEESPKPAPTFLMHDPNCYIGATAISDTPIYVVFQDVLDTDGTTVKGNMPVIKTDGVPSDNYIKYEYTNGVVTITLKNIHWKRTDSAKYFIRTSYDSTAGTNQYDVVIELVGKNTFESLHNAASGNIPSISLENQGKVTITGSGSLEANVALGTTNAFITSVLGGDLLIKDTTITAVIYDRTGTGNTGGIVNNGSIIIDNSTVNISGMGWDTTNLEPTTSEDARLYAICTGTKPKTVSTDTTMGVTIKNGSVVTLTSGKFTPINTSGRINIENSTVEISKSTINDNPFAPSIPYVTGCSTVEMLKVGDGGEYKAFASFELAEGTALTTTEQLVGFKTVHECAAQADDGNCTTAEKCACGKEVIPAKQHIAGANADDCTKDTICGNPGCTQVFEAATATAHTPKADDGDCTTDILCANPGCTQVATKGAEKHKDTRTDCGVAGTCANPGCQHAFAAGQHTGGTATCKAKAKCDICSKEYGELGACKPAADDGDCTTDIKCSVCGKTTTAGETAHKYTDKNDTTCDNAGCTNTRKVEGTENPKTGDNSAIAVVAALMVTAAAAFVTTKKFAR